MTQSRGRVASAQSDQHSTRSIKGDFALASHTCCLSVIRESAFECVIAFTVAFVEFTSTLSEEKKKSSTYRARVDLDLTRL
jgi:hypothetical protein